MKRLRTWLSPAERLFVAVLLIALLACPGCQAGFWKEAGDNAGKGSFVGALGTVGFIYGGPLGGFGGTLLGYYFIEVVQGDLKALDVQQNLWAIAGAQEAIEATASPMLERLWDRVVSLILWVFGGWLAFYVAKQVWWEKRTDKKLDQRLNST